MRVVHHGALLLAGTTIGQDACTYGAVRPLLPPNVRDSHIKLITDWLASGAPAQ
jgi:hypothetical protein